MEARKSPAAWCVFAEKGHCRPKCLWGTVAQLEKGQRPPGPHLGPPVLHSCQDKTEGLRTLPGLSVLVLT